MGCERWPQSVWERGSPSSHPTPVLGVCSRAPTALLGHSLRLRPPLRTSPGAGSAWGEGTSLRDRGCWLQHPSGASGVPAREGSSPPSGPALQ